MDTIIVVDDDEIFCRLLKTVLEFENYQVVVEPNPDNLLPTVHQVEPTLVLMDVHSQEGDTLDVLRELRADDTLEALPVVMTSGMDRSEECLKAGATDFILKPFRPTELITLVADLVARKKG
ncbi:MAG: response regulator [Chloroflexota bacterium]|nr:response regulator [Chloroflexota bacterium]